METNLRVSPTLLDSYNYYSKLPDGQIKNDTYQRILDRLNAKSIKIRAPALSAGNNLEAFVNKIIESKPSDEELTKICKRYLIPDAYPYVKYILPFKVHKVFTRIVECNGRSFKLIGDMDLVHVKDNKAVEIVDIKSTGIFEEESYYSKWQAYFYMFCGECPKFSYLVFVWDNVLTYEQLQKPIFGPDKILFDENNKRMKRFPRIKDVKRIEIKWNDMYEHKIVKGLNAFIDWINSDTNLSAAYYSRYCSK